MSKSVFDSYYLNYRQLPSIYSTATLYVPWGTKAKYEKLYAWSKFENIVEMMPDPEGIEEAVHNVDNGQSRISNLGGRILSAPQKGVNVVRSADGTVRKILVK